MPFDDHHSYTPLPAPPRQVVGSFCRGLRPNDWAIALLTLLPIFVAIAFARMLITNQWPAGANPSLMILGAVAFELLWAVGLLFFWVQIARRINTIRRLCRAGLVARGLIISTRIQKHKHPRQLTASITTRYLVAYLFTNPHSGEPAQLEAQVSKRLWQQLKPGMPLNVLVESAHGKSVIVYEFCPFRIVC